MNALRSSQTWTAHLARLYANERHAAVEFLLALSEFDEGGVWKQLGHANLFSFLHVALGMSKSLAYYRQTGARLVRAFPAVVEPLRDGRLCVSSLVELSKVLDASNWEEVLPRFFGCSKREAQKVAVAIVPVEEPPMRDVIAPRKAFHPGGIDEATAFHPPPAAAPPDETPRMAPPAARPTAEAVAKIEPLSPVLHRIHFTAKEGFVQKLEEAKDALARRFPDGSLEEIFEAGLDLLLAQDRKRKGETERPRPRPRVARETSPAGSRYIPASVRREVWKRDRHRCQWGLESGGRCGATRYLEIDHVLPRARGGPPTVENLRVLCRVHNQRAARDAFGEAWMRQFAARDGSEPPRAALHPGEPAARDCGP